MTSKAVIPLRSVLNSLASSGYFTPSDWDLSVVRVAAFIRTSYHDGNDYRFPSHSITGGHNSTGPKFGKLLCYDECASVYQKPALGSLRLLKIKGS